MKHPNLLALACVIAVATVACKPQAPVEPAAPPVAEAPEVAAPAATAPPVAPAVAEAAFDPKAFAGTFTGTLPCTGCPGTDTTLELKADGTYLISEQPQGKPGPAKMDGTWTVEASDRHIRLDPNTKAQDDRLFAIASNEQIEPLDAQGKPAAGGMVYSLKREAVGK